ncbi:MAG TPA: hypothetical protein VN843_24000, partial [Anaerolineales bacterium]|nr:hypothetical protein [Anaerolineales bacterium]
KGGNNLTPDQFARACDEAIAIMPSSAMDRESTRAVMNTTRQTRGVQIVEVPRTAASPPKVSKTRIRRQK